MNFFFFIESHQTRWKMSPCFFPTSILDIFVDFFGGRNFGRCVRWRDRYIFNFQDLFQRCEYFWNGTKFPQIIYRALSNDVDFYYFFFFRKILGILPHLLLSQKSAKNGRVITFNFQFKKKTFWWPNYWQIVTKFGTDPNRVRLN